MRSKKPVTPLCVIDTKTGHMKRYVRAEAPRHPGDTNLVKLTDTVEVSMESPGDYTTDIDRFRTNPEFFQ